MTIAFISDVHGNLPALEAAVAHAKKQGAEEIICAGDLTGYGPFPKEVCDYLENNGISAVSGNYDYKVIQVLKDGEKAAGKASKKKRALLLWTAGQLGKPQYRFLKSLPDKLERRLPGGQSMLVVHGTPTSNDEPVYPSVTTAGLSAVMKSLKADVLVCGHTHIPFIKRTGRMLIVNCGSTGYPIDHDWRPSYALLAVDDSRVRGRIVRFEYNIKRTLKALKATSLPEWVQMDFSEGTKRRFE